MKRLLLEVLKKELNSIFFLDFIKNLIIGKKLNIFYRLLITLHIFSEISTLGSSTKDFYSLLPNNNDFFEGLDFNLLKKDLIKDLIDLSIKFLNYEITTEKFFEIEAFMKPFHNAIFIHQIELKNNFFLPFFDSLKLNKSSYDLISNKLLIYSVLPFFGKIISHKLFRKSMKLGLIDDFKNISDKEFALIFYFLNNVKNNIYYKIKLDEFRLQYEFLEKIFEFYQRYQDLNHYIISNNPKTYSFKNWRDLYQFFIVPLDKLFIKISESKRLFWRVNEYEEIVKVLKNNLIKIINSLSIEFIDFLKKNYSKWVKNDSIGPISVVNVFRRFFKPNQTHESQGDYHLFLIIDCCTLNIWEMLKSKILEDFQMINARTIIGTSILPTSTKWARRALASGTYPIKHHGTWNEAYDFFDLIKTFNIQSLSSKPNPNSYYVNRCELLDQNDKAINLIENPINFQYCVFNISDESGHYFDSNTVIKIINSTYNTKIKPLLQSLFSCKSNPIIYFATDHGIVKILNSMNWKKTNFNSFWNLNYLDKKNTHPRFFISEVKLSSSIKEILKIESNQEDFALKSKDITNKDQFYYFATRYENFKGQRGRDKVYFAHGGASLFEFLIPFAILSKNLKIKSPNIHPSLLRIIKDSKCKIIIKNPFDYPIKNLAINIVLNNYYFRYYLNEIKENKSFIITRQLLPDEGDSFKYLIQYFYAERCYSSKWISFNE